MRIKRCCVPCCSNNSESLSKLFMQVPANPMQRQKWLEAINFQSTKTKLFCCEDHFDLKEDADNWMFYQHGGAKHIILKKDVVPHLNLKRPLLESDLELESQNKKPRTSPRTHDVLSDIMNQPGCSYTTTAKKSQKPQKKIPVEQVKEKAVLTLSSSGSTNVTPASVHSLYSPTQSEISASSKSPLHGRRKSTIFLLETKSRFYLGLPEKVYSAVKFVTEIAEIKYLDVLITLKKVRTNHVYSMLGDDFELSTSAVKRVFSRSVPILASCLQELIVWPDFETIYNTLPLPFQARYSRVQAIIDCLEIEIEKPSNPVRQALSWSEYKKCNTVKFLISSTPSGSINFISGAYGGRTSDKEIVEHSGFLEKLRPNTWVMADRGFKNIEKSLVQKKCKLVRPPSVPENVILEKKKIQESKRIASLRIHIERVIKRIREFRMLDIHARINHNLLHLIDSLIIIVCGVINIQGPLIHR